MAVCPREVTTLVSPPSLDLYPFTAVYIYKILRVVSKLTYQLTQASYFPLLSGFPGPLFYKRTANERRNIATSIDWRDFERTTKGTNAPRIRQAAVQSNAASCAVQKPLVVGR